MQSLVDGGSTTGSKVSVTGGDGEKVGHIDETFQRPRQAGEGSWPNPASATTSLMDYIKPNMKFRSLSRNREAISTQQQLEKMFPQLDAGLIAAILSDYSALEAAEEVLGALCGN